MPARSPGWPSSRRSRRRCRTLEDALAQVAKLQEDAAAAAPRRRPMGGTAEDDGAAAAASGLFFNGGTRAGLGGRRGRAAAPARPLLADPAAGPGDGLLQGEAAPPVRAAAAGGVQRIAPLSIAAGTIIPASLITGINSDIPGSLVAQVRENVYDTLTGTRLLIPQGSRLVGAYGSDVIYGQERVRAGFNRLIRPDGTWIALESVEASDTAGMAGLADDVNNHWGKLIVGAVISATFSLGVTASQGTPGGFYPSPAQAAAANAAGSIGQTGAMFAQRQLDQKPTITIRPGFSFDIIVTRDILLPVYDEAAARGAGLVIPAAGGSQP
ncbi:MAG: TrbI/VirB10 family protein [Dongiaceae bacterium]